MATHLIISGRVQGVGYRDSMRAQALRLGLSGWVRNRSDGSVEAMIQGPSEAQQAMLEWVRRGPPLARVENVNTSVAPDQDFSGFRRLPTQ